MVRRYPCSRSNRRDFDPSGDGGRCSPMAAASHTRRVAKGRSMTGRIKSLLRGDAERLANWLTAPDIGAFVRYLAIILIGSGIYGFTLGIWRAPLQSFYTAVKFPL